jgi:hypothetical protein
MGYQAGQTNQGNVAVAIGYQAGFPNQVNNSIAINATCGGLTTANSGLYVNPVRNCACSVSNAVYYNTGTHEITHGPVNSATGPTGPAGAYGPTGPTGFTGAMGVCGPTGPTGSSPVVIPSPVQTAVGMPTVTIASTTGAGACHATVAISVTSYAPVISTGVVVTAGACANAPVSAGTSTTGCQSVTVNIPGSCAPFTAYAYLQTPFTTVFSAPVSGTSGS